MNVLSGSRVVVGMSGGVDSSVAAALLKERGYSVTGVTMRLWDGPAFAGAPGRHGCYGPSEAEDIEDARRVALVLDIPFNVLDLSREYKAEVLDYFQAEYASGRTPNPCTRCNPAIKFGSLVDKVRQSGIEFDYFATGHYAKVERPGGGARCLLRKGRDAAKDQSYFLALLSREQLMRSLFPLGDLLKTDVRQMAVRLGLPVAEKPDSQDFADSSCSAVMKTGVAGPILDRYGGQLGQHKGYYGYTIGQRKGLGLSSAKPLYVTGIDPERNAVIVGEYGELLRSRLVASKLNWLSVEEPAGPIDLSAKIRARHEAAKARLIPSGKGEALVEFEEPQMAITPGQTIVFYDGDIVLGGGVIDASKE
jgi:tRNA-uridine 2-sulfurtransferase